MSDRSEIYRNNQMIWQGRTTRGDWHWRLGIDWRLQMVDWCEGDGLVSQLLSELTSQVWGHSLLSQISTNTPVGLSNLSSRDWEIRKRSLFIAVRWEQSIERHNQKLIMIPYWQSAASCIPEQDYISKSVISNLFPVFLPHALTWSKSRDWANWDAN